MEWKKYKLKDICKKITDGSHFSPQGQNEGYPMFSVKDMLEYGFDYSNCKRVSYEDYLSLVASDCVPQEGDILVAKDGSFLKQIFVCKETKEEGILSSIAIFRPDQTKVDSFFLCYLLKSPSVYNYIANNCVSGSALPRIVLKDFKEVSLKIPPLPIQRRIAAILSSLDAQIENNNRINRNLEAQAQALFKSWFVDFEPWNGQMPDDWKEVSLDEMTSKFGTGLNPRKNFVLGHGNNYYVTIKNMGNNRIYLDDKCDMVDDDAIDKINKRSKLVKGDLLFSGIGTIGRVAYVEETPTNWNTSESIFNMHPSVGISSDFLYLLLLSDTFQNYVQVHTQGGVQQGIRMASLKAFTMYISDETTLRKFDNIVQPILSLVRKNHRENDCLAALRDTLLPKLMKGEIEL